MPLRFFTTTRTGEIQSRLANDVGGVQSVVTSTAASLLSNIVIIASSLVAMLLISVQLTILSLCITPIFVWLTVKVGRARRKVASSTQQTLADLTGDHGRDAVRVGGSSWRSRSVASGTRSVGTARRTQRLTDLTIRQTMIGQSFFAVVGTFFSITPAHRVPRRRLRERSEPERALCRRLVAFTTCSRRIFFPIGSMLQDLERRADLVRVVRPDLRVPRLPQDIQDDPAAVVIDPEQVRGSCACGTSSSATTRRRPTRSPFRRRTKRRRWPWTKRGRGRGRWTTSTWRSCPVSSPRSSARAARARRRSRTWCPGSTT